MNNLVRMFILGVFVFTFTGCSQKYISVTTIAPAEFAQALNYKRLSIIPTQNDTFQMNLFLEEKLLEKNFNDIQLFQIVSTPNKQTLASSKIDAYIAMHINVPVIYDRPYYAEKIRCNDSKCKHAYTIYVPCIERNYGTSIHFQMIDAKTSNLIFSKNFSRSSQDRACQMAGYDQLPDTMFHLKIMQERMVNDFISLISPTFHTINAKLAFKEPEIDLTNQAEKTLNAGIEALKENNLSRAQKHFESVLNMTNYQSYVATHNLGLVYEAKGDFTKANTFYQTCLTLLKSQSLPLELHLSLERIDKTLLQEHHVIEQMKNIGKM